MKTLDFDEQAHKYYLVEEGGARREIPGVTSLLKAAGIIDESKYRGTRARDFGTEVHEALELVNKGVLPVEAFEADPVYPYLLAHQDFLKATGWKVFRSESRFYHPAFEYAGTTDVVYQRPDSTLVLADYKTGGKASWHGLQLTAYREAFALYEKLKIDDVGVLYLKDGKYTWSDSIRLNGQTVPMSSPVIRETWTGVVRLWKWKGGAEALSA
jgi:hypothetical protein